MCAGSARRLSLARGLVLHEADLGGDDGIGGAPAEGAAEQALVAERAVDIGRVEEGHAKFERPREHAQGLLVVDVAGVVLGGHPDAAQADRADGTAEPR